MSIAFDVPQEILHQLLDPVPLPRMARLAYRQPTPPPIEDVAGQVRMALRQADLNNRILPGARVAVAVGSRGIARLPEIVSALVAELRVAGARPFIVPSMGSHGGATPAGQQEVLRHLGITESSVGAPIESQMDTAVLGSTKDGMPVYMDRLAAAADGIVLVARIKPHTAFHGTYESGLAKMMAIGLGKQRGAATTHTHGFGRMAAMVPAMARVVLDRAPIVLGLAILENAHDLPFKIEAVPADRMMHDEPGLLDEARAAMPRLPFQQIDVLIIDRIGKNISGDGADPNVTGRYPTPDASGGPEVNKQVVLDLTEESRGNANGVGTSDFTTARLARKMSLADTYPNALTSTVPGPVKLPMVLPSDLLAIKAAVLTCHAVGRDPRIVRIRDTLSLGQLMVSEVLLPEVRRDHTLEVTGELSPLPVDVDGNLTDLAPTTAAPAMAASARLDSW
jgi:hypothetical protein